MGKIATLSKIERGFGGDTAIYDSADGIIMVAVNWGLLHANSTSVIVEGKLIKSFTEKRFIQPTEALTRLGYNVNGVVDFAQTVESKKDCLDE